MSRKLVIFGLGDMGQLAQFYFEKDSPYEVAGFTLDVEYLDETQFNGLPVVPFDEVESTFPPEHFDLFVALGYSSINAARKQKYLEAKQKNYTLPSYLSSKATVLNGDSIGDNCFVLEDNTIQPFVTLGNNVVLWSGNHIGHHSTIKDHTFITSHVVVSGGVTVGEQCFLGVNCTLRDRITVGERSVFGAGALVMEDAEAESLYVPQKTNKSRFPSTRLQRL
ncbi:MAG: acetyltransferase [Rubripirellula sp.]|nr:acetyltransferase [Rubripirellula sp.]